MSDAPPVINDPVALRKQYLNHEASIRSLGTLYYLGAVFGLIGGVVALLGVRGQPAAFRFILGPIMILLAVLYWKIGVWLRDIDVRGRVPATILACLGLIGFPIGTLISVYILYLLNSKKAAVVFSDEYFLIVEATPQIKYKTSWLVIALALLLGIILIFLLIALAVGKH
jgi:hypothetical protein